MLIFKISSGSITIDPAAGKIISVTAGGRELLASPSPLFALQLRDKSGAAVSFDSGSAASSAIDGDWLVYNGLPEGVSVRVKPTVEGDSLCWRICVKNDGGLTIEWVDFPIAVMQPLKQNGGFGEILLPYNEGAIVDDIDRKEHSLCRHQEPEYPSLGCYAMFPNMICSQFMCYLTDGLSLYMGAHDAGRSPKGVDFYPMDGGAAMRFRLFAGVMPGEDFAPDYPVVWSFFSGRWEDGAEIYRRWFEENLPDNVKKILENPALPEWYADSPLIVTYPVRGIHDMDTMNPNALFPYCNALPMIDRIAEATGWRILVLLMHWEGTAPWAPPYVWPPFGGEEIFEEFLNELHRRGDLLGVYCSGFGFTEQSNLIKEYNNEKMIGERGLLKGMCAAPGGEVQHSRICTGQRSGYDLCVKSETAKEILAEAYEPLFGSGVDYAQILDQNHGGGQYFCYSDQHGHPPVPGQWMTDSMRELLDGWNKSAPNTLFGCESAAAEPFIGNLLFSDNRFELNWSLGRPVPLHAYLYHEYLRNFMGNQVSCPLDAADADGNTIDTMRCRMAYSFAAGDSLTLVITPEGKLMANWGRHDFTHVPDFDKTMDFARNMRSFYEKAKRWLHAGRMVRPLEFECPNVQFPSNGRPLDIPSVFSSAWESDGKRMQMFVNHTDEPVVCRLCDRDVTVGARDAAMIEF